MDSNHRMSESKSDALPLGETPKESTWWAVMDSNHCVREEPGLQPGAINRSANCPRNTLTQQLLGGEGWIRTNVLLRPDLQSGAIDRSATSPL